MVSRVCGYCGVHSHFALRGETTAVMDAASAGTTAFLQATFSCAACNLLSLAMTEVHAGTPEWEIECLVDHEEEYWASIGVDQWLPQNDEPSVEKLPVPVAVASAEAHKCFKAGQFTAAVLMARTTIEASAKARGIDHGTLAEKVTEMGMHRLITNSTAEAAAAIRNLNSNLAHGDLESTLGWGDARDAVELMELILREVFELPCRADELRDRARKRFGEGVTTGESSAIADAVLPVIPRADDPEIMAPISSGPLEALPSVELPAPPTHSPSVDRQQRTSGGRRAAFSIDVEGQDAESILAAWASSGAN